MQVATPQQVTPVDRRSSLPSDENRSERRQFGDARESARPEVKELANAIDEYKMNHRRKFITFEEIYDVVISLGYHK